MQGEPPVLADSGRAARNDANEAMEDTQAELNDISSALNTPEAAGESAGGLERPSLPEPLLHRRLDKERPEKEKAFGITYGGPIISYNGDVRDSDYQCVVLFFKLSWIIGVESADCCAGLAGNFQSKVLFEMKESEALGEAMVLQNRMHPSQQKFFDLLGTHCPPPSPVFFKFIHPGGGPSGHNMHTMLIIHPGLEHLPWYGRNSPQ